MAFQFFLKNYRANLMSKATKAVRSKKSHGGRDEEMAKAELAVTTICNKLGQLSKNELSSIFDFLVEMCQNSQTLEPHAISLGTHLLSDFYEKSQK